LPTGERSRWAACGAISAFWGALVLRPVSTLRCGGGQGPVGIPILSAIAATQSVELVGIHLALGVDVAVTLASVALISAKLHPGSQGSPRIEPPAAARQ
jgi:hypothetical protein